jgi:hypothetical protein
LFAWTDNKGFRYRAAVAPIATPESSRLVESLRALVRGLIPELPALELRRARIVAQSSDGRVSLQQVERDGTVSDFGSAQGAVRLYAGTPGTSADLDIVATETRPGFAPETILAFTSADQSSPVTFLAAPLGQPGHVPLVVRHEAWNGIRFVGASSGKVFVGESPTYPVLLAPTVLTYLARIEDAFLAIDSFLTAAVGPYGALVTARKAAYTQMANGASAARLEAK